VGGAGQPAQSESVVQAPHVAPPLLEPELLPELPPLPPPLLLPEPPPLDPPLLELVTEPSLPPSAAAFPGVIEELQFISAPTPRKPSTEREAVVECKRSSPVPAF
jgi:hypothetical protein